MLGKRDHGPTLNFRQKIVVVVMDLLFLAELAYGIYAGQQNPEYITAIFLRTFIPMALTTLLIARILIRKLHTEEPAQGEIEEAAKSGGSI